MRSPLASQSSFCMRWLTVFTMTGCLIGLATGLISQAAGASDAVVKVIGFAGHLWVRALKLMVVPMIFTSMVLSVSSSSGTGSGKSTARMASLAIRFYMSTTVIAAFEGLVFFHAFVFAFEPLAAPDSGNATANLSTAVSEAAAAAARIGSSAPPSETTALDTLLEFGDQLVPENLVRVFYHNELLGVITVGASIGASVHSSEHGPLLVDLFKGLNDVFVALIKRLILLTPLGVGSLVAGSIGAAQDVGVVFRSLGALFGVVVFAQAIHAFGVYSLLYMAFVRRSPVRYFSGLLRVWATAFGTASSAATLSTTNEATIALGVSAETANFVLPIGATVNMDGSALERPIAVLWIAHVAGIPVDFGGQLVVVLTAVMLSVGASPIPSAGVSTLIVMVEQANVPLTPRVLLATSICLAVEWLFDRVRTTVNVTGDAIGVAIVDHLLTNRRAKSEPTQPNAPRTLDGASGVQVVATAVADTTQLRAVAAAETPRGGALPPPPPPRLELSRSEASCGQGQGDTSRCSMEGHAACLSSAKSASAEFAPDGNPLQEYDEMQRVVVVEEAAAVARV